MTSAAPWRPRLPDHFKQTVPAGESFAGVVRSLEESGFPTVCQEAQCPNRTDCWARGTLTFQILGALCTRRCAFCAETTGRPGPVDATEPDRLVAAVRQLKLRHVVITSPARDDLADQGADQFAACVSVLRRELPRVTVEVLVPDFQGRPDLLERVFRTRPDVFNHNIETVRRLTPAVRARATYDRSLAVLSSARDAGLTTKSGLMLGLGETAEELETAFQDLREAGVRRLTVGQYLPPSPAHARVEKFYTIEEFRTIHHRARELFDQAMVGPLVRSSYHADEMVLSSESLLKEGNAPDS